MTDSRLLAQIIYRAYVAPVPEPEDLEEFCAALELYATTRLLERAVDVGMTLQPASPTEPEAEPEAEPPKAPVSESDTSAQTDRQTDRQTDGAGNSGGEAGTPGGFAGKGSGEKRQIYERMTAFCKARGPGARRAIAKASNGALAYDEVLALTQAASAPLAKWREAAAAMDFIEEQEANGQ